MTIALLAVLTLYTRPTGLPDSVLFCACAVLVSVFALGYAILFDVDTPAAAAYGVSLDTLLLAFAVALIL